MNAEHQNNCIIKVIDELKSQKNLQQDRVNFRISEFKLQLKICFLHFF